MILDGTLKGEELEKRKAEELKKIRHKKESGQCRIQTDYGVIKKNDVVLRIAGRAQFLAQIQAKRKQLYKRRLTS